MVTFINPFTGTETMVADDRKDEYLGAGYTLAPGYIVQEPIEEPVKEVKPVEKAEPVKKTVRTKKK